MNDIDKYSPFFFEKTLLITGGTGSFGCKNIRLCGIDICSTFFSSIYKCN